MYQFIKQQQQQQQLKVGWNCNCWKMTISSTFLVLNITANVINYLTIKSLIKLNCYPVIVDKFAALGADPLAPIYAVSSVANDRPLLYFRESLSCVNRLLSCACADPNSSHFFSATALDVAGAPIIYISSKAQRCFSFCQQRDKVSDIVSCHVT